MSREEWNDRYRTGTTPWDLGAPDPHLVELWGAGRIAAGRALDIGCGAGSDARWLAEQGFQVVGIDLAPLAIERARGAPPPSAGSVEFHCLDFLKEPVPSGPFDLVFDRGCFHVFDAAEDRARFAARVAELLAPGGRWVSVLGSTEGPPREEGPPRRTARDVALAVEPVLALEELRASRFRVAGPGTPSAWLCIATRRSEPAQPSTRR